MKTKIISFLKENILIFAISLVLCAYFTWPFVKHLSVNYSEAGDFAFNGWMFWYNTKFFLLEQKFSIFLIKEYFNSPILYPFPFSLAHADTMLFPSLFLYAPFYLSTNNHILAVNITIFLSYILNFLSAFYSTKYVTKSKIASLVSAIIFSFSPISQMKLDGHLEYLFRFLIPPFIVLLPSFFGRPTFRKGLILSLLYTLNWFTNIQLSTFLTIFSVFIFVVFLIRKILTREKVISWVGAVVGKSLAVVVFLPLIWYFFYPYLEFSTKEGLKRELPEISMFSAKWYDFFLGSPSNRLMGKFYLQVEPLRESYGAFGFNYSEHTLFPGFLVISLLLLGLLQNKKTGRKLIYYSSLLFGIILSFGPFAYLGEKIVALPYYYIYKIFPILAVSRVPTRMSLIWIFFAALIVALVIKQVLNRNKTWVKKTFLIIFIFSILILEYTHSTGIKSFTSKEIKYDLKNKRVFLIPFPKEGKEWKSSKYQTCMIGSKDFFRVFNVNTGSERSIEDYVKIQDGVSSYDFDDRWFNILLGLEIDYLIVDKEYLKTEVDPESFSLIVRGVERYDSLAVYNDKYWKILDIGRLNKNNCVLSEYEMLDLKLTGVVSTDDFFYLEYWGENDYACNLQFLGERRYLPVKYYLVDSGGNLRVFPRNSGTVYLKIPPYILEGESFNKKLAIPRSKFRGAKRVVFDVLDKRFIFDLEK